MDLQNQQVKPFKEMGPLLKIMMRLSQVITALWLIELPRRTWELIRMFSCIIRFIVTTLDAQGHMMA
ncbi:hypothetical protein M514_28115 [Trichuris suis]|uniref:Uncharacterized protein n=1 Tax=Trichuris suis TaxID=68888 RepID=A0A085MR60_9BILA|nr:hypothetical protein M514_28115 [Trichuris suis]